MKIEVSINIERVGAAEYEVQTDVKSDGATHTASKTYSKTNNIFPLYNSLMTALRAHENVTAIVSSNSQQFNNELKTLDKRQTTLATTVQDIIAVKNIGIKVV